MLIRYFQTPRSFVLSSKFSDVGIWKVSIGIIIYLWCYCYKIYLYIFCYCFIHLHNFSVLVDFKLSADIRLIHMHQLLNPLSNSIRNSTLFTVAKTAECKVSGLEVVLIALIGLFFVLQVFILLLLNGKISWYITNWCMVIWSTFTAASWTAFFWNVSIFCAAEAQLIDFENISSPDNI